MSERIQLRRTKGWRMPPNTVKVDRSTRWGNPWIVGRPGRLDTRLVIYELPRALDAMEAVLQFESWIDGYAIPNGMRPDNLTKVGRRAIWDELASRRARIFECLHDLRGKNLACWCSITAPDSYVPCHADVLLSIANDIPLEEVIRENYRRAKGEALQ